MAFAFAVYGLAAAAEIGGCFAFWLWLRGSGSPLWTIPGALCLFVFAILLTRVDTPFAGRAFAAYGGVYIAASLCWSVLVEKAAITAWDMIGALLCVAGAAVILAGSGDYTRGF